MKACDTCEQRWLLELYGYGTVTEITISHETDQTVMRHIDRGPLGASTSRISKTTEHTRVFKTEAEAWQALLWHARKLSDFHFRVSSEWDEKVQIAADKVRQLEESAG